MITHANKTDLDDLGVRVEVLDGQAPGGGPTIQHGVTNLTAGQNKQVTFSTPFASAPTVLVTPQFNLSDTSASYSAHTVTTDGFMLRGAGNPAGDVAWLAIL